MFAVLCFVPLVLFSSEQNGLKADEWLRAALEACGGRGGGRATSAQGQAADAEEMGKGMAAAEAFIAPTA